ncbi:glycosyltransferase family 59 protein [Annulohypoxylon bovei var. microspora]|nr:glycosyltransferase family 59 protein [Annulohypoxylon bovei var. microspora]
MASWLGLDPSFVLQLVRYGLISTVLHIYTIRRIGPLHAGSAIFISLATLTILSRQWLSLVTKHTPEPYLDEVFHIPQAQVYCDGRYSVWDDKITTPPGLYALTILANKLTGFPCSAYYLRLFNVEITSYLAIAAIISRARLEQSSTGEDSRSPRQYSAYAVWTGINIALFPVLFFFSGLYYTDVVSTFVVLLSYTNHLGRVSQDRTSLVNDVYTLFLGLLALCMRQTNIFWVVVYMGGLEVVHGIKTLRPEPVATPAFTTLSQQINFYAWRYSLGDIHDPPLDYVCPVDLVLSVASIGLAAIYNLPKIIFQRIWPHVLVLGSFVGFVAWNGGVVLGDKFNHVATLHLAQMLYIWPLFAFFSAPLFIPQFLNLVLYTLLPPTPQFTVDTRPTKGPSRQKKQKGVHKADPWGDVKMIPEVASKYRAYSVVVLAGALVVVAALIVKFNTIIHPFTLADNRHYMFYVFRYTILRAWWIRYALIPVYLVCGWSCWVALQGEPFSRYHGIPQWIQTPFGGSAPVVVMRPQPSQQPQTADILASTPPPTSTVLILLLAATLSLVTAPLVEPRYFIIPWVFWRLLVPAHLAVPFVPRSIAWRFMPALETAWFLLINAATMYMFVTRPFYWKAPDGELLDGGRVQRFMW